MRSKWSNSHHSSELISAIRKGFTVHPDGTLSQKIGTDYHLDSLYGLITHDHKLDDDTLYSTLKKSVEKCFIKSQLSSTDNVLLEFDKACNIRKKVQQSYRVIAEVNIKNIYNFPNININNCKLVFYNTLPEKYKKARDKLITKHGEREVSDHKNYTFLCISVNAVNYDHAVNDATEALGAIRSIFQINFLKRRQLLASSKEGEFPSRSVIKCGEFFTLHFPSGKIASLNLWANSSFQNSPALTLKSIAQTTHLLTTSIRKTKNSPYSSFITTNLINYCNAIDQEDPELRFLKLWSTLERLTMTDNSATLVKRASFFYEERALHQATLESLRNSRNTYIHGGHEPINAEMKNHQLCIFIETLLHFYILNPFKYSSNYEIIELISLRTNAKDLKTQIAMLKTIQKFITPPQK